MSIARDGTVLGRMWGEGALALLGPSGVLTQERDIGTIDNHLYRMLGNGVVLGMGHDGGPSPDPHYPWVYKNDRTHLLAMRRPYLDGTATGMNRTGTVVGYDWPRSLSSPRSPRQPVVWRSLSSRPHRLPIPSGFADATTSGIGANGDIYGVAYATDAVPPQPSRVPVIWQDRKPIQQWHPPEFTFSRWIRGVMIGSVLQADGSSVQAIFAGGVLTTYVSAEASELQLRDALPDGTVGGTARPVGLIGSGGFLAHGDSIHVFPHLALQAMQPNGNITAVFESDQEQIVVGTCLAPLID